MSRKRRHQPPPVECYLDTSEDIKNPTPVTIETPVYPELEFTEPSYFDQWWTWVKSFVY